MSMPMPSENGRRGDGVAGALTPEVQVEVAGAILAAVDVASPQVGWVLRSLSKLGASPDELATAVASHGGLQVGLAACQHLHDEAARSPAEARTLIVGANRIRAALGLSACIVPE